MANIRDVAKDAGVSAATVSKYLNNTGYISSDRREAIKKSIEQLNYAPSRRARQLKLKKSGEILCILPDIEERLYREIYISISSKLGKNYRVVLALTEDSPEVEVNILRECLNDPCAGVLLCTCNPSGTALFQKIAEQIPIVFLQRKPEEFYEFNYVGFDHTDTIRDLTTALFQNGFTDIALFAGDIRFSCEAECVSAFESTCEFLQKPLLKKRVFNFPYSREAVFRSTMRLLDSGDPPSVFLTTSYAAANAIHEVAHCRDLEPGRDLFIFALGEDNWYNSMFANKIIATYRDAQKLGSLAADTLLDNISMPGVFEKVNLVLPDSFNCANVQYYISRLKDNAPPRVAHRPSVRLRFAAHGEPYSFHAIKSLLPQFIRHENIEIEIEMFEYKDLHNLMNRLAAEQSDEYDIFTVDAHWLSHLYHTNLFDDLSEFVASSNLHDWFMPQVLDRISTCNGKILGIPFVYSLPLLFYRKDLFTDAAIAAKFYKQHKVKLAPPTTWNMYNLTAAFFTQSLNPDSPTRYGTSLLGGHTATALCAELYPRIWAYNGKVIGPNGFVRLYSHENYRAYQSIIQTLASCAPENWEEDTYHGIRQLISGNSAMCTMFSSNASLLADGAANPFRNHIGYAPLPGQKPVTTGWSLACSRYSKHPKEVERFFRWFCSLEISSAFTTLGGTPPIAALLEYEPFLRLYPWTETVKSEYHTSIKRESASVPGLPPLDELLVEEILVSVISRYRSGGMPLSELILDAHQQLCQYAESMGYPKNIPPPKKRLY